MGRFQTIRCHCSLDFLKALAVAERVFQERERKAKEADVTSNSTPPEDSSTYGGVGVKHGDTHARRLLLIDNVAAFYWLDRASRREQGAPLSLRSVHHASAARLQELSRRCRAPIIVTKATTSSAESTSGTSVVNQAQREGMHRGQPGGGGGKPLGQAREHRDFLPQQWTSAVTQRLVLDVERTQGERRTQGGNDGEQAAGEQVRGRGRVRQVIRRQVGTTAGSTRDAIRRRRRRHPVSRVSD